MTKTIEQPHNRPSQTLLNRIRQRARGTWNRLFLSKPLTRFFDYRNQNLSLGDRGEIAAERFLLRKGWYIVARGFETEMGEIDLIAVDHDTVVFVEVKTRVSTLRGLPEEAVDEKKQQKIAMMAEAFIRRFQLRQQHFRFDVIAILWPSDTEPQIKHLIGAFEANPLK